MTPSLPRAIAVWFAILVLAILNGAARELFLTPTFGDTAARAISTITLCLLIAIATWLTIGWMRPSTARGGMAIGASWLSMTLAFEFLAGHYLFGKPWPEILADYDVRRGRIWIAVLLVTLFAPRWAAGAHRLLDPGR